MSSLLGAGSQFPFFTQKYPSGSGQPGDGGAVTNVDDPNNHPEDNIALPWCIEPSATMIDWRCAMVMNLDPGLVLHKPLPQGNYPADTLASVDIQAADFVSTTNGVNLKSNSQAVDLIQRMASSTFRFALRGWGLRAGYQVQIPGLFKFANLEFTPDNPQYVSQEIVGNLMGGIPLWYAEWDLNYIITVPPNITKPFAVTNPAAHIRPDAQLPNFVQVPRMPADQHAVQTAPPPQGRLEFGNIVTGGQ